MLFVLARTSEVSNKYHCLVEYILYFLFTSLYSRFLSINVWTYKESIKDPTHFISNNSMLLMLLITMLPEIIIYILMIIFPPAKIHTKKYDDIFLYEDHYCVLNIHPTVILFYVVEYFFLISAFGDIFELISITSFSKENSIMISVSSVNIVNYLISLALIFREEDNFDGLLFIFVLCGLVIVIQCCIFYIPRFIQIFKCILNIFSKISCNAYNYIRFFIS